MHIISHSFSWCCGPFGPFLLFLSCPPHQICLISSLEKVNHHIGVQMTASSSSKQESQGPEGTRMDTPRIPQGTSSQLLCAYLHLRTGRECDKKVCLATKRKPCNNKRTF